MKDKKDKLQKANEAITISGRISLLERKCFNVLLFYALQQDLNRDEFTVDKKDLCALSGFNSRDNETLKKTLRSLYTCPVEWDVLRKGKKTGFGGSALLADAELDRGKISYSFSAKFKKKLLNPQVYTWLGLEMQKRFSSKYALAMYEIFKKYERVQSTGWIAIDKFRKLTGSESEYYDTNKKLNARVIKPALQEINRFSDLEVRAEFKRTGRSISHIRFKIKQNKQPSLLKLESELYKAEAQKCWKKTYGNCAATWERYKDTIDHACHYCSKFSQQRLNP